MHSLLVLLFLPGRQLNSLVHPYDAVASLLVSRTLPASTLLWLLLSTAATSAVPLMTGAGGTKSCDLLFLAAMCELGFA
jgi:hypothetical protein